MPIPLPNLDDRSYADLMEEMKALIPRYAPEWTDHNESDPGIMLVELFAWLTEAMIYRLNRVPEASEVRFLELLGADFPKGNAIAGTDDLRDIRAHTVTELKRRWRAITEKDFENLVIANRDLKIARAKCLSDVDLTAPDPDTLRPGHVTVVVVPSTDGADLKDVTAFLDERRLITCCHHVVQADYIDAAIRTRLVGKSSVSSKALQAKIMTRLEEFFDPVTGGPDRDAKSGWPFGRDVYVSEVFQVIEETEGVEHVESLGLLTVDAQGRWIEAGDRIPIRQNSLVAFATQQTEIAIRDTL